VVDGEAAAGSQGVGGASGGSSKSRGTDSCSSTGLSSSAGGPWNSSTAAPLANSAQGKDSQELGEARGRVFERERGQGGLGEDDHRMEPSLASALSLSRSPQRGEAALSRLGRGGEEWSGVRGRMGQGRGFYSRGGRR
jgi:hypothetical protein